MKLASRSSVMFVATHARARAYSSASPIRSIVSSESTTVYPMPPAGVRSEPLRLIGWYSSAPIASRSAARGSASVSRRRSLRYGAWSVELTVCGPCVLGGRVRGRVG